MQKPFSKLVTPKPSKKEPESEDKDKPALPVTKDKISELLRTVYPFTGTIFANWTESYLEREEYGRIKKYYCDRYYPELKIALDKFYTETEYANGGVEFKRTTLNAHGIRYITLTPQVSFEEAITTAETQRIKK